jgi:1-acyl-sn-glycerol-3-phosphate acyltransferase
MDHSRWITGVAGWIASVFHEVEVAGEPIPRGPVLVVANHPNSLLDPLIIFRVAGRPTRPLAKAPLFEQMLLGTVLRGLGGLPVYRRQDDAALMHRNDETFRRAIDALAAGAAVQIYPEGTSHSAPSLAPLRTGAARIALGAESQCAWQLGLRIVPIGLTYTRKARFRGKVLATIGAPFAIAEFRAVHAADPQEAVRALTGRILQALEAVTLNAPSHEDAVLIDVAERMYAREKGLAAWREHEPMADRMPRMQAFARGLSWLRAAEPEQYAALARRVERHRQKLALLGVEEGDVPLAYTPASVVGYVLRNTLLLVLGALPTLIAVVAWYPMRLAARAMVGTVRPEPEAVATYKLTGALLAAPIVWLLHIATAAWLDGPVIAGAVAVLTPLCGLAALGWHRLWRRVREDTTLFATLFGRRGARARIAADRAALVRDFDRVIARMQEEPVRAD